MKENIELQYAKNLNRDDHNPVVFAERVDDTTNPTVLIYGHYDVQPTDPIEEWKSNPFKPVIKDGNIYARGATDNKGQLLAHLAAISYLASSKWGEKWPVNIKILIEGEEEDGGENISEIIKENRQNDKYKADVCLISDGPWENMNNPTIEYGLRGITYMQVDVVLSDADLHSGLFGGVVLNPVNALVEILSKLKDVNTGKVLIPDFYNDVVEIDEEERKNSSKIPFNEEEFKRIAANAKGLVREDGYTYVESKSARPTLDINGIWGGFQGEGAKTIIPGKAHAKVSMRLVADQDPDEIAKLFENYVKKISPEGVEVSVKYIHGGRSFLVGLDSEYLKLAEKVMHKIFGNDVLFARSGGSIPVVADIQNFLGVTPILVNLGLPDDGLHSPNEKMALKNFYGGIEFGIEYLSQIKKVN